jgi:hypothetical protein
MRVLPTINGLPAGKLGILCPARMMSTSVAGSFGGWLEIVIIPINGKLAKAIFAATK